MTQFVDNYIDFDVGCECCGYFVTTIDGSNPPVTPVVMTALWLGATRDNIELRHHIRL